MGVHKGVSGATVLALVTELGSATEAAKRLGISKQAVGYYTRRAGTSPVAVRRALRPPPPAPLCPSCGMIVSRPGNRCHRCSKLGLPGTNTVDLRGQRFGRLKALEPTEVREHGYVVWKCRCDCGREVYVNSSALRTGNNRSCGCLQRETAAVLGRRPR